MDSVGVDRCVNQERVNVHCVQDVCMELSPGLKAMEVCTGLSCSLSGGMSGSVLGQSPYFTFTSCNNPVERDLAHMYPSCPCRNQERRAREIFTF